MKNLLLFFSLFIFAAASLNAQDIFMKIKEIKGDSQDNSRKDQFDILAFEFGISQSGTMHMNNGGGGNANFGDIALTLGSSPADADFIKHVSTGQHIKEVIIYFNKGGSKDDYITYTLNNVIISSFSTGGSEGEQLTTNITLNFGMLDVLYKKFNAYGAEDDENNFGWDISRNTAK